jgi:hypothetical protein
MATFVEEQRVQSRVTGNEGVVLSANEFVMVQFDNGERAMMGADQLDSIPGQRTPPPIIYMPPPRTFVRDDEVICINPVFANGQRARVMHQDGGKLWVVWIKHHWKYGGQADGQYSADSFDHWHESVESEAA